MTITRRTVCWAGATALIGTLGVALTGRTTEGYRGPTRTVRIAGGQVGGFYKEFAQVLAGEITSAEPNLRCEAIETGGSVSNIELIHHGRADIGVSQADIALAAVAGDDPFAGSVPICGIGRMYEDYLQLVVRDDSPVRTVRGLGGRTVSIGALGSGTAIFGKRLFDAVEVRITKRYQALPYAAAALERRQVDAVLWSGGVPTPALTELHARVRIRLLPIVQAMPALRDLYGTAYQQVSIPAGGYGRAGTPTIGVANLLVCRKDLPDDVAAAITRVLVDRAARLVPRDALGAQFLDRRTLIGLFGVPTHPGAAATYRQLHR